MRYGSPGQGRILCGAVRAGVLAWMLVSVCGCDCLRTCGSGAAAQPEPAPSTAPSPEGEFTASASIGRLLDDEPEEEELSLAEIRYRSLFKEHCGKCHKKPSKPKHFTDAQWRAFLPKHAKKTKVDPQGAEQVLSWLVENN